MSETKTAPAFAEKQIYRVTINAPIETVWSELVNTESPRPFFYNALCDTREMKPGEPYRMVTKNYSHAFVVGEVLEMEPPHLLVQSFKFTDTDDAPCKVTYALKEVGGGVEFSLITENVPAGTRTEKSMDAGGKWITKNLKAYIENGKVTFSAQLMLAMMGAMSGMAPKATRIENWPLGKTE